MQLLTKLPGKHYFISIFIIGAALFGTFSAVIYRHYDDAQRLNEIAFHDYEIARQTRLLLFNLLNMETGVRGYLLTGRKRFIEPYSVGINALPGQISAIRDLTKTETDKELEVSSWLEEIEKFHTTLVLQMRAYNQGGRHAFSPVLIEKQRQQMDVLREKLETRIVQRLKKLQLQLNEAKTEQQSFTYILILGTVLAIGAMLLATLIILGLIAHTQRAGQETAVAEERFRLVMNGVNDGVYDFNFQNRTIYYSPAYRTMLGYTEDEFPDSLASFNDALHPDDAEAAQETFRRYKTRESDTYINMFRMRHKNDSWIWVLSRGVGFWDANGRMTRLTGTHTDITEHKKREEELAQVSAEMETFIYVASHDLRSPLVNLKGFTGEIQHALDRLKPVIDSVRSGLPAAEQTIILEAFDTDIPEALAFIEKSTDRMDTLTNAVLDLSRIGRREYRAEPVDSAAVIQKCLDAQAYEITRNETEVFCHDLPTVVSDPLALEQIFGNLIDNAVKYLDLERKGKITISARETAAGTIFAVEDNGRGILEADKQKIFEMFRRARNTDDVRGAGLGMAFVKASVRRLGGTIWVDSTFGSGSVFYVRLPKIPLYTVT